MHDLEGACQWYLSAMSRTIRDALAIFGSSTRYTNSLGLLDCTVLFVFSKSPMDTSPRSFTVYLGVATPPAASSASARAAVSESAISLPDGEVAEMSLLPLGLPSCGLAGAGAAWRLVVDTAVIPATVSLRVVGLWTAAPLVVLAAAGMLAPFLTS